MTLYPVACRAKAVRRLRARACDAARSGRAFSFQRAGRMSFCALGPVWRLAGLSPAGLGRPLGAGG